MSSEPDVLKALTTPACISDQHGIVLDCNSTFEKVFGWAPDQVIGRAIWETVALPNNKERDQVLLIALFQGATVQNVSTLCRHANGTLSPALCDLFPLRDEFGAIIGIVITVVNESIAMYDARNTQEETFGYRASEVQERNERLQALTDSLAQANHSLQAEIREHEQAEKIRKLVEKKYRSIFENAIEGIFQTTPDGSYVTANPAVARIFGYESVDELLVEPNLWPQRYHHPKRHQEFMDLILTQGSVSEFESQAIRKDGSLIWLLESVHTVYSNTGQLLYFEGTVQDITARKQAEQEIISLNARLERRWQRIHAMREIDLAINSNLDLSFTLDVLINHVSAQLGIARSDVTLVRHTDTSRGNDQSESPNYFTVPLVAKGQVRGTLAVARASEEPPESEWEDFLEAMAGHAAIAIDNAVLFEELQRSNLELRQAYDATIEGWSRALDLRDHETEGHTLRVVDMTLQLAQQMGMEPTELVHIRRGALLHDIGKMGIPDSILLKPARLTEEEWKIMRQHPNYAYEMLAPIAFLRAALDIPYCHHEKWNGTGYPRGLAGEEIPLVARIFAVIDVWDALRSNRPYRTGWSDEYVLTYIQSLSGIHFDPQVVTEFLKLHAQIS